MGGCHLTQQYFLKDLLNRIGYYNENFIISSDYDFIIRMFKEKTLKYIFLINIPSRCEWGV